MKIRTDFVSNSSSCSFVIESKFGSAKAAIKTMIAAFSGVEIPWDFSNVNIILRTKNKWFDDLYKKVTQEKPRHEFTYSSDDPEEVGWDGIPLNLEEVDELKTLSEEDLDRIEKISFECEDSDITAIAYLRLFYLFFERNECAPNATDSEHRFLDTTNDDFTQRLVSYCREDKGTRND